MTSVRFRIRTPGGQELSFASEAMFEDFVRSGDLSPDDLVYDAEDGSWAPARTHPIVLEIEYEQEEAEATSSEPDEATTETGAASEDGPDDLGLSLAPEAETASDEEGDEGSDFDLDLAMTETMSPEEAQRAFVERLEAERASEREMGITPEITGFTMDTPGSLADIAPPEPTEPPPASKRTTPRPEAPTPAPASGGGAGRWVAAVVVLTLVGAGGWYGLRSSGGTDGVPDVPVEPIPVEAEPEPERQPVIGRTRAAVRERAHERFLTTTQAELRDLQPVPDAWPGGGYLATPSAMPEVLDVWQTYLATSQQVRAADTQRYRAAYEAALDDAIIEGEERATRLADALVSFDSTAAPRAAHYDRVEALASAAIQSHNALLEVEGRLIYDGAPDAPATGPVGAGVTARDEDAELLLQQVAELLGGMLEAEGGPGSGENVRAWVWDGFLDAVTR